MYNRTLDGPNCQVLAEESPHLSRGTYFIGADSVRRQIQILHSTLPIRGFQ